MIAVGVRDPQRLGARALSIEDAGEEPLAPRRRRRPAASAMSSRTRSTAARRWLRIARSAALGPALREHELGRATPSSARKRGRAERLEVRQREAEPMDVADRSARASVGVGPDVPIAADQAAEIAAAVVGGVLWPDGEAAEPEQLVVERQMGAPGRPLCVPVTCFQPRRVRKRWSPLATSSVPSASVTPVRGLTRRPVSEHLASRRSGGTRPGGGAVDRGRRRAARRSRCVRPSASRTGVSPTGSRRRHGCSPGTG